MPANWNRREFLSAALAAGALGLTSPLRAAESTAAPALRWPVCVFVKFLQSLNYDDLATHISQMGFQGIEATIRSNGQIKPQQAVDELPKLVEALRKKNLEVTIMTSNINRIDSLNAEAILKTAASLGIKQYRMDYYQYDISLPVAQQLQELKPAVRDLAAMNKELGIQAVYQNHAGVNYVGASVWDLVELLEDIPVEQIGIAYDTRHSAIESGLSWPVLWNLVQPKLAAIFVKNAAWNGLQVHDIPLAGKGVVDDRIFRLIQRSQFQGPISLHVEYLEKGSVEENLAAIAADFKTLQNYLKS